MSDMVSDQSDFQLRYHTGDGQWLMGALTALILLLLETADNFLVKHCGRLDQSTSWVVSHPNKVGKGLFPTLWLGHTAHAVVEQSPMQS
jgi:hypothetical protein